ncbi:MAG: hypothetical protein ACO3JL_17510, partial [Myxococcota bacterium]
HPNSPQASHPRPRRRHPLGPAAAAPSLSWEEAPEKAMHVDAHSSAVLGGLSNGRYGPNMGAGERFWRIAYETRLP